MATKLALISVVLHQRSFGIRPSDLNELKLIEVIQTRRTIAPEFLLSMNISSIAKVCQSDVKKNREMFTYFLMHDIGGMS